MEPTLHPKNRLPTRRSFMAVVVALLLPALVVGLGLLAAPAGSGLAQNSTPPVPPTFVPTPIGPPPPPPVFTSTPGPTVTSTASPAITPGTLTATASATATAVTVRHFTLEAARLSQVGNPGNLQGLAQVKHGARVWLMMYYTLTSLPKPLIRTTTYRIGFHGKTVYRVTFRSKEKKHDSGRFSRYTAYSIPSSLPYGTYYYHATLTIGKSSQTRSWKFRIGPKNEVARQSARL